MKYYDPLTIVNPKLNCPKCNANRNNTHKCEYCGRTGYMPSNISGLWGGEGSSKAGFLVGGGKSLNDIPTEKLKERGIVSLAINNSAGHVPVSAWVFSDPQEKFHNGLYQDPSIMTFAPVPKLKRKIRKKEEVNGEPKWTDIKVKDCPNTYGFERKTYLYPEKFLSTEYAMWGYGGNQEKEENLDYHCLCTMLIGIRLMCYLGCTKIFMLGVDFWRHDDQQYAFGQWASTGANGRYVKENAMFADIRPTLENSGISVYNCNPDSRCTAFDYVPFDIAFEVCKGEVPEEPFDLSGWYEKCK
jgi:hypothetical protein